MSSPAGDSRLISFPDDHPDSSRMRLAQALRPLINLTVSGTLDDAALEEAADTVERIRAELAAQAGSGRRRRQEPEKGRPAVDYLPTSPVAGVLNPIAPPVRLEMVDGENGVPEIRGTAWFDYPYEGPPNCVHGGVIAATFDEVLGAANIVAGSPGMTGTLNVRYRKPTPLRAELRLEGRFLDINGRKIRTWGGMYHGDVLTAEAEGLFIEVIPSQMLAIAEQNSGDRDDGMLLAMRQAVDAVDGLSEPGHD